MAGQSLSDLVKIQHFRVEKAVFFSFRHVMPRTRVLRHKLTSRSILRYLDSITIMYKVAGKSALSGDYLWYIVYSI